MKVINSTRPSSSKGGRRRSPSSRWSTGSGRSPPQFEPRRTSRATQSSEDSNPPRLTTMPIFAENPPNHQEMQLQANGEQPESWQFHQPHQTLLDDESYLSQGLFSDDVLEWVVRSPVGHTGPEDLPFMYSVDQTRLEAQSASSGLSPRSGTWLFDNTGQSYSLTVPEDQVIHLYDALLLHKSIC